MKYLPSEIEPNEFHEFLIFILLRFIGIRCASISHAIVVFGQRIMARASGKVAHGKRGVLPYRRLYPQFPLVDHDVRLELLTRTQAVQNYPTAGRQRSLLYGNCLIWLGQFYLIIQNLSCITFHQHLLSCTFPHYKIHVSNSQICFFFFFGSTIVLQLRLELL